jgi:hypothetical protein
MTEVHDLEGPSVNELFREMLEYMPSTSTISVIGRMRTGKSTFSKLFGLYIRRHYESQGDDVYLDIIRPDLLLDIESLEDMIRSASSDVNILIFDDLSFLVSGRSKAVNNFLNFLTRIAHITFSDYNYIFFIGHYSKSISPFLRASNVVVLTSISHPEISSLKELFTLGSLYDYLYYYTLYPKRFIYLLRYHTIERIIDFTQDQLPKPRKKNKKVMEDGIGIFPLIDTYSSGIEPSYRNSL